MIDFLVLLIVPVLLLISGSKNILSLSTNHLKYPHSKNLIKSLCVDGYYYPISLPCEKLSGRNLYFRMIYLRAFYPFIPLKVERGIMYQIS